MKGRGIRSREKESERERDREKESERERDRESERDRERVKRIERERERESFGNITQKGGHENITRKGYLVYYQNTRCVL